MKFSSALELWLLNDHRLERKEPNMVLIGVAYHPSFQTIAFFVEKTDECGEYLSRKGKYCDHEVAAWGQ